MRNRRIGAALAAAGALTLTLSACGGGAASLAPSRPELTPPVPAPTVSGTDLDDATKTITVPAAYGGKILVVNVWASWCSPCRAETPLLEQVAQADAGQDVQFVGILFRDSTANGHAFRRSYHVTYPSLTDPQGVLLAKFRGVNPTSIPDTFVLDRSGKITARFVGAVTDQQQLQAAIADAQQR